MACLFCNVLELDNALIISQQAASLFKGPVPPVVAFSLGSLGFMTPFCILNRWCWNLGNHVAKLYGSFACYLLYPVHKCVPSVFSQSPLQHIGYDFFERKYYTNQNNRTYVF